ncbi:nucleoside-diphosphate sugar epimerase/dehydratase [Devosia sp. Root436]|uniref:nucleoside-diphosphate sugar epimerase/dehydratase n=1 Tax=Devosia sp. Root436 TaxID=1736537 RepID=UPI000AF4C354|nr:nucleoside-diphosphate sugar epimerase/dehydratase [Devosia sp. Root436]
MQRLAKTIITLPRWYKQLIMVFADVVILLIAASAAYLLRYNLVLEFGFSELIALAILPIIAVPVFLRFGLYRSVIRYMGERAVWTTCQAVSVVTLAWAFIAFLAPSPVPIFMPRSVPYIFWPLALVGIMGSRFAARDLIRWLSKDSMLGRPILIYGAGSGGNQLAFALHNSPELRAVAFIDDDRMLHGRDVAGLRVYGPDDLDELIEHYEVAEVIVTVDGQAVDKRRAKLESLERFPVTVRILPPLADIASGRHLVNLVRQVEITDLLGREPVVPDADLLERRITGKQVLVTGAGGSIGSELCRHIVRLRPERLILLECSEAALYQIDRNLRALAPECEVVARLGSIGDRRLLDRLFAEFAIDTVYHAAAHKHVPLVENNVLEAARNNVLGTQTLVDACLAAAVKTFVLISTDKAVRPTNVMGATKRWAELLVQEASETARLQGRMFCAVRFGNVLGSSGSVIPLFREQIAAGGPVTLTHREVTRYFMSIPEAVALVIQAGSMAVGGEIFVLEMGEPIKIYDLARNMIHMSGQTVRDEANPHGDIEIKVTGLREGEKLYEELLIGSGNADLTAHPRVMRAHEPTLSRTELGDVIDALQNDLAANDVEAARRRLLEVANRA